MFLIFYIYFQMQCVVLQPFLHNDIIIIIIMYFHNYEILDIFTELWYKTATNYYKYIQKGHPHVFEFSII